MGALDSDKLNMGEGTKKEIDRKEDYKQYAVWKSMPSVLKGGSEEAIELRKAIMMDDDKLIDLLECDTQASYAKKYNLSEDTLTDWNVRLRGTPLFKEMQVWVTNLAKNVMLKMYQVAMKSDPKAHNDRKAFLNYAGIIEKMVVEHQSEGLGDMMKRILKIE